MGPELMSDRGDEERIATSAQFIVRLTALAVSGRITASEYEDLLGW
jgi:hypothetical protein